MLLRSFLAALAGVLLLAGAPAAGSPLRVAAAASLKEGLDALAAEFRRTTGQDVVLTYAATSALARQIEAGAPFDIFISADIEWMDHVAKAKLVDPATRRNLLGNALVLIAPKASLVSLRIERGFALAGALGDGKLAIANPDSVPAGKYAKAALDYLGAWPAVATRTVRAENVRIALTYVARGEVPLGIVYRTDALADAGVRVVDTFPAASHPPIVYPAARVAGGQAPAATARAFLGFAGSEAAARIWKQQGFAVLPE